MYKKKLLELGIPADLKGFKYLNTAIMHCEPSKAAEMYSLIADNFADKPSRVERAMRTAISHTKQKISVSRFIANYQILWGEDK